MKRLGDVGPKVIADAWNAAAGSVYAIDAELVSQNLLDSALFDDEASRFVDGAFVAIKRSAANLYNGPDPKVAHLSLFAGTEAPELLEHAVAVLKQDGVEALVVGMDSGHFLPGAPEALPWAAPWLEANGFVAGGEAVDLERDMVDYTFTVPELGTDHRTLTEEDIPLLETFLKREFPGRWHFDMMRKIRANGPSAIFGMFLDGACEGFASLQGDGGHLPLGGAIWRNSLGPHWGSLGPIGISKALRGKGHGNALLGAALLELRDRGARQSIIDWTSLVDFYGAHGFVVTRRYRSYRRAF